MSDLETGLDAIVTRLGRHYGAISRSDFVSLLFRSGTAGGSATGFDIPDPTPGRLAAQAIMSTTEGGLTTPALIASLDQLAAGRSSDSGAAASNDIPGLIKICYEPELVDPSQDRSKIILRADSRPQYSRATSDNQQGAIKSGESPNDAFSIKNIAGFRATSTEGGASVTVNSAGAAPGSTDVTFSVVQVFSNRLSTASRDMGALTLFMNAIPTIEISRAVPFIDVVLIQEGGSTTQDAAGQSRISSLSLGQFFMGNAPVTAGTVEHSILTAVDEVIAGENRRDPEFTRTVTDPDGTERSVVSPIATAGMELFTAPQTLVNADEDHYELDAFTANQELQTRRQSAVIDKFRPLMTLSSLNFTVAGAGGMMSYKSGKMKLIVHDRSRLAEVSALIKPSRYGTTHMVIEYGWSHPDAPVHSALGAINEDNLHGSLIGALRVKEKYHVVNSSFSFDDTGQVEVELSIAMLSNRPMRQVQISLGLENNTSYNSVRRLTQMIEHLRSRLSTETAEALFGEGDLLGSLTSPAGAISTLDNETVAQINRVIRVSNRAGQQPELAQLGDALENLLGTNNNRSGGSAASLRRDIQATIRDRVSQITGTSDPFFVAERRTGRNAPRIQYPSYVSLGKIISTFVAGPLVASGYYKDVQIIFYNFNEKASYMANRNIATFPVEVSEFRDVLTRELDQLISMPIESFVNFMSTYFLSDPASKAYGFSALYQANRDEDGERQLLDTYEDNSAGLLDAQQQVLEAAYGSSAADLEFKQPTVSMALETVPVRENPDQTILRIHITDSQATSHMTLQSLLEASSAESIGLVNTAAANLHQTLNRVTDETGVDRTAEIEAYQRSIQSALDAGILEEFPLQTGPRVEGGAADVRARYRMRGGFGALKSFIMRTVPSVRYGEGNSGIISARISSMSDPALTTVNMQRQGRTPETPTGAREQGVPLTIAPVECTLETIGCPLWSFSQQIFIDFGTGTTADAIYGVTGVDHSISSGEFKTSVKLTPMNSYARYTSLANNLENALIAISAIDNQPRTLATEAPATTGRRRGGGRARAAAGTSAGGASGGASPSAARASERGRAINEAARRRAESLTGRTNPPSGGTPAGGSG